MPAWVPLVGRRRVPGPIVFGIGLTGVVGLVYVVGSSIANWEDVNGFADQPGSGWEVVMVACYAPAAAWPLLLLALTVDHARRRGREAASEPVRTPPGGSRT